MAKAPGRNDRDGLTLFQVMEMFPDDATAEKWFEEQRWPDGICCPKCGSVNVQENAKHKTMAHRCRDCRKFFSVKIGTVMQASNLGYRIWAIAIYLMHTGIKGTASMKLHRDLGITYTSAWHLSHRIRECWSDKQDDEQLAGPVEVDETYVGGVRKNMSNAKRKELAGTGRGGLGSSKAAVVGLKDRDSNKVRAEVVQRTDAETLHGFIDKHTDAEATVYTDEAKAYQNPPYRHDSVKHSASEYVKGDAHTNGMESFWSLLKRGHKGTYHKMSQKHLHRYVREFAGRHNARGLNTAEQKKGMVPRMEHKRLRYEDLTA